MTRKFITKKDKKYNIRQKLLKDRMLEAFKSANKEYKPIEEEVPKLEKINLSYEEKLKKRRETQKLYRSKKRNGQPNLNDRMKVFMEKIIKKS